MHMHKDIHTHAQSGIHVVWTIHKNQVKVLSWLKHVKGGGYFSRYQLLTICILAGKITNCQNMVAIPPSLYCKGQDLTRQKVDGYMYVYTSVLAFAGLYSSTSTLCDTCGRSIWVLQKKQDFWMTACCNFLQYIMWRLVSIDLLTTSCHQTAAAMTFNVHNYCLQCEPQFIVRTCSCLITFTTNT